MMQPLMLKELSICLSEMRKAGHGPLRHETRGKKRRKRHRLLHSRSILLSCARHMKQMTLQVTAAAATAATATARNGQLSLYLKCWQSLHVTRSRECHHLPSLLCVRCTLEGHFTL